MRRLQMSLALLIAPALVVATERTLCDYGQQARTFLEAGQDEQGYFIRVADPAVIRADLLLSRYGARARELAKQGLLDSHVNFSPVSEMLAREASAAVLYLGIGGGGIAITAQPIALDGVWRGADPLSCLQSFAEAAGLKVLVPEPRLWLVGSPEQLDHAALVVFTYSMTAEGGPAQPTDADVELARAIVAAQLPIREVAMAYEPVSDREGKAAKRIIPVLMGVGTYWVPGEPDTLLAVVSRGAFTFATAGFPELDVFAYKIRVTRDGGRIKVGCLWGGGVHGPLIPGFAEDLDGDGMQEYFFTSFMSSFEYDDLPDQILSGADGRATEVITGKLAVEKRASGPKHFAVGILREEVEGADLEDEMPVLRFAEDTRVLEVALPEATATQQRPERAWRPRPEEALASFLGGGERMRVYVFGKGGAFPVSNPEIIRASYHPVWENWFFNRAPAETIESIPASLPIRIVYKVLTPGYLKERQKEKEVLGR